MREKIPKGLLNACHESAHAVVCLELGLQFKYIRLSEIATPSSRSFGHLQPPDKIFREDALRQAVCCLAGIAFEKLARPHWTHAQIYRKACSVDETLAREYCEFFIAGKPQDRPTTDDILRKIQQHVFRLIYRQALRTARQIVKDRWSDIVLVGKILAKRGELTQAEVEAILVDKGS